MENDSVQSTSACKVGNQANLLHYPKGKINLWEVNMKYLITKCRESDNFAWGVVVAGTLLITIIAFYGR